MGAPTAGETGASEGASRAFAAIVDQIVFREVNDRRWEDLTRLFEGRGGPKHCWCMVWRAQGAETRNVAGRSRKAALKRRVRSGIPIGLLGYLDGEPVAWCSVAPRSTYRPLGGPEEPDRRPSEIWSIVCFFIVRRLRRMGVMERLLQAAVDHARHRGAKIIEAYPVEADSPSYRFMGFLPQFSTAGFHEIGLAGTRRHVMRLHLTEDSHPVRTKSR